MVGLGLRLWPHFCNRRSSTRGSRPQRPSRVRLSPTHPEPLPRRAARKTLHPGLHSAPFNPSTCSAPEREPMATIISRHNHGIEDNRSASMLQIPRGIERLCRCPQRHNKPRQLFSHGICNRCPAMSGLDTNARESAAAVPGGPLDRWRTRQAACGL